MARLRTAPVEFRYCPNCDNEYSGQSCPRAGCNTVPTPTTKRVPKILFIIDGADAPFYERKERCKCPQAQCRELFDLEERDIDRAKLCRACGTLLFYPSRRDNMFASCDTRLARARALARERERVGKCGECGHTLVEICWCPFCRGKGEASSPLPPRPTWLYVPTGALLISLDQLDLCPAGDDDTNEHDASWELEEAIFKETLGTQE